MMRTSWICGAAAMITKSRLPSAPRRLHLSSRLRKLRTRRLRNRFPRHLAEWQLVAVAADRWGDKAHHRRTFSTLALSGHVQARLLRPSLQDQRQLSRARRMWQRQELESQPLRKRRPVRQSRRVGVSARQPQRRLPRKRLSLWSRLLMSR